MWIKLLLALLLFPTLVFSQEQDKFGISGFASARGRYQEGPNGNTTHNRIQDKLLIDAFVSLTESNCLKAYGQVATGKSFSNTWNESGIGDADANYDINLRRLYLDMNCYLNNVTFQAGAIAPQSAGSLGIKEDGWVDGVRAILTVDKNKKIKVVLTAGAVGDYITPNVFNRDYDGFNYYQIALDGNISDRVSFIADFSEHDTNEYMRAALKIAIKDLVRFIDNIGIENTLTNGHQHGTMFSADKQVGQWKIKISQTDISGFFLNEGTLFLPTEDFYGVGRNYQLYFDRPLGKKWVLKTRLRDGDAGKRFEVRMDYKFKY